MLQNRLQLDGLLQAIIYYIVHCNIMFPKCVTELVTAGWAVTSNNILHTVMSKSLRPPSFLRGKSLYYQQTILKSYRSVLQ